MEYIKRISFTLLLLACVQLSVTAQITEQGLRNKLSEATTPKYPSSTSYSYTIWDDIPDMQSWGVGYMYNGTYPLTLQANYQISYFSCLLDMGIGFDKEPQYISQTKTLKTNFYLGVAPGVYFKYVSVNCGFGFILCQKKEFTSINIGTADSSVSVNGEVVGESSTAISYESWSSVPAFRFLLKPSITGYIPVDDDDHFLTVSVGYNYAPAFKAVNGWSFGVGFQFPLDY